MSYENEPESTRARLAQYDGAHAPSDRVQRQVADALHQQSVATTSGRLGYQGPHGFIPYPGVAECGDDFMTWATKIGNAAGDTSAGPRPMPTESYLDYMARTSTNPAVREGAIGARDLAGAYAARQASALGGSILGLGSLEAQELRGLAQLARAPGKMFSRSDILAILRADHAANGGSPDVDAKHHRLIRIFENLE